MNREAQIKQAIETQVPNSQILRIWQLHGGMSAELFGVEFHSAEYGLTKWVARFPSPYVRKLFNDPATHEFNVLKAVCSVNLPAPPPIMVSSAPDGNFFFMSYLPGAATANPKNHEDYITQFAQMLARIHRTNVKNGKFDFLPKNKPRFVQERTQLNKELMEHEVTQKVEELGYSASDKTVLRHGDFWPGNLLVSDEKISGVVDWENALIGPALADLAISRLDIYWVFGREAMESFTDQYLRLLPQSTHDLTYWDLRAALRPMSNLKEWVGPYASLGKPDMTFEHMQNVLLEFTEAALSRDS